MTNSPLAWHYTTGQKFILITQSGCLDPKKTVTPLNERPILWFSKNQYFEPTAQKAKLSKGKLEQLGMMGTHEMGDGLFRFGYPVSKLTEYKKLCRQAGMGVFTLMELERIGLSQGAKPSDWMGTFKRIKIKSCVIEEFNGTEWQLIEGAASND